MSGNSGWPRAGRRGTRSVSLLVAAATASLAATASGGTADWVNPAGGAWETPANWATNSLPASSDAARFALPGAYDVSLATSPALAGIDIAAGDLGLIVPAGRDLKPFDFLIQNAATARLIGGGFITVGDPAAAVSNGLFRIASGQLSVSGFATELRAGNNDLELGTVSGAPARLDVFNSGIVGTRRILAATVPGSTAFISVRDNANNSLLKTKGSILGVAGSATLSITNEGRFNADPIGTGPALTVGFSDGVNAGTGYVVVDGNTSLMNMKGEIRVGDGPGASGTYVVTRGARAGFSGTNSVPIAMNVGPNGGDGRVLVTGRDSNLKLNGQLLIRQNADGHTVRVESGGQINASSVLYNGSDSAAKEGLVVKGLGASLDVTGGVDIASGDVLLSDSAVVTVAGNMRVGASPNRPANIRFESGTFRVGQLTIDGGNLTLTPVRRGEVKVVRAGSVLFATPDSGVIDLADNAMMIDYADGAASPIDQVRTAINPTSGPVSMARITSSVAALDPQTYALGTAEGSELPAVGAGLRQFFREAADNSSVLVRYTFRGDANLDGAVDLGDFSNLASSFGAAGRWSQGDFNYDGSVDVGDFALMAANFNRNLVAGDGTALPRGSTVPEPAGLALLAGAALLGLRRRRA